MAVASPVSSLPQTIDQVILALDGIIECTLKEESPLGYFPALYRKVTQRVREGIKNGEFEDNERMERLDVLFANRYLKAYEAFRSGQPLSQSWRKAFDFAQDKSLLVIQHLLLGMNAHINLDLGIAAAATVEEGEAASLKSDFMKINEILIALVNSVQNEISKISPLFRLLDIVGGKNDERVVDFGLVAARNAAWMEARRFSAIPFEARENQTVILDEYVADLTTLVLGKKGWLQKVCRIIKMFESKCVQKNIRALADAS